jgi:hypothetical protein
MSIQDEIDNGDNVPPEFRPIFDQLQSEFRSPFEVWRRTEGLGTKLSACIKNRDTNVAAICVVKTPGHARTELVDSEEIDRVRSHLLSSETSDMMIDLTA